MASIEVMRKSATMHLETSTGFRWQVQILPKRLLSAASTTCQLYILISHFQGIFNLVLFCGLIIFCLFIENKSVHRDHWRFTNVADRAWAEDADGEADSWRHAAHRPLAGWLQDYRQERKFTNQSCDPRFRLYSFYAENCFFILPSPALLSDPFVNSKTNKQSNLYYYLYCLKIITSTSL